MLLVAANPNSQPNKDEQNIKRVVKKLSEEQMSQIREENEAESQRRIEREEALSEVLLRDVVKYDNMPEPKEVKSISDINSILDYQTKRREPVTYDKDILTNQEGVTSTMTEKVKQGRYPHKEIIENEVLHKINQILSEHRFKKYFAHLEDEKAHELREDSYVKIKEIVKKEKVQFERLGVFTFNNIFNDIDAFVNDEKAAEASIQTTIQNFDQICAEHESETMNGILTWPIFDKYIQKGDAQKHHIYKKYITRNPESRKELFDAIDSINPDLSMASKSAAYGGINALDVIKFKVAYQVIYEDLCISSIPERQLTNSNKKWGPRETIRQKIKTWAKKNVFEDRISEEKAQITESVHNGFLNKSFLDKDGVSYWHTIVKRTHTRNLNFIEVLILEPYNRILNPISMNDWVKRNGFTREQVLQEAREKMTKSFEFDETTMKQIYYLNFDQLMDQSEKIEQITQKAYLAFENIAYIEHLKHQIRKAIKEWLFKKLYRFRYVMSHLSLKLKENYKPKKTYESKSSDKFPFKKFSMDRTISHEHFLDTFDSVEKFRQAYDRARNMTNYQDWNEEQEDFLCRQIDYKSFKRCLWMDPAHLSSQQTMSHFEETYIQGQRFIRTLKSQRFYDLEDADFMTKDEKAKERANERKITRHMTNLELVDYFSKKWRQKVLNQYVMRFYKFDHIKLKFERQHESFYSIQKDSRGDAGYNIDILTTLRNNTYFFKRDLERNCFYLYRHQMSTPPINGAETEWDKLEYKNYGIEEKLGEYAIQIDVDTPIEDVQIVFLKPAHQFYSLQREQADDDETTFLHKQFVAVYLHQKQEKTNLQIFYLKSAEKPILDYSIKDINFQAGWYIRENQTDKGKIKFIIKGVRVDQTFEYEFRDESLGLGMLCEDNPKLIKQNRDAEFNRSAKGMFKLIHRELLMKWTSESFVLTYFHGHNLEAENIQCINPIRGNLKEQLPGGLRNKEQEIFRVLNEIHKYDYKQKGPWLNIERDFTERINESFYNYMLFKNDQEFTKYLEEGTEYHNTDDMLIQFNRYNDFIQIYRCSHDMTWLNFKKSLQAEKEKQNVTQLMLFEQFDQRNQTTYQDNYSYQSQNVRNRPNQYIKQLYKHRIFSKVITTHNTVQFMGRDYKVDEDFLLIDLDGNSKGHMSMIKLYQDKHECHRVKWGLKLMKYQVSFSKKKVFFAFQALNKQNQGINYDQLVNQSGLYFFVVKELEDVKKLVRQTTERDDNYDKCLLNRYQYINVFCSVEKFQQFKFGTGDKLKEYQDNYLSNHTACTNHVQFEVLHDTAQQDIAHIVPFIFMSRSSASQRKKDSVSGNRLFYRPYMTLIDISKYKQPSDSQSQNHLEYSKFIHINQFKYQHENNSTEEGYRSLFYHETGANKDHGPFYQFSRCSNWQKNIKRRSNPKGLQNSMSARFQIGLYCSPVDMAFTEIRDIMITVDLDEKVQKVDSNKLKGVKIDYVGMNYLFGSGAFKHFNRFLGKIRFTRSHYLIPKVDDEGNISGTYFMYNVHGQESKPIKLKSGKDYKDSFQKYKDDVEQRWDRKYHQLEGQWVNPIEQERFDDLMCVLAKDGVHYWVGYDSIECYNRKTNHDIKNYKSIREYIENQKKVYEYVPVEINNDAYDKNLQLETNLAQLGISKQVVFNQPNQFLMTVSTKLLDDVIKEDYLDKNMQMLEIHRLQQQMMCMSFINFKEVFRINRYEIHMGKSYFQPRSLLNGQNLAANDFPMFLTSIENLNKAMSYTEEEANSHIQIENSPLDILCGTLEENNREFKNNVAEFYFKMMGINKYQNFFYDLNNVSIIQRGLDLGYIKPVQYILKKIQDVLQDGLYQDLLMQDLPQLMCQVDVKINDFVNRDEMEDEADDQEDESRVEDCNIEVKLREPELPFMGPTSIMEREFHEFDNIFDLKQTIEEKIIEDFQTGNKIQQPELNWNLMLAGIGEGNDSRILVDHYLMNFLPSVQKIKIDLMMNRKDKEGNTPVHLERFSDTHPADYNCMYDFIMADYIDKQRVNESFFEQSSVCKLIDRQFQYTRIIYMIMLFTFTLFFLFPFIYGLFVDGVENPNLRMLLFIIGSITQFLYFILEIIEIYQIGTDFAAMKEYFVGWNTNDFTLPLMYTAHVFLYYYWHQYEEERKYKAISFNLITISVLVQAIFKCLQYVRVIDSFGFLVEMIISVIFDLFPFVAIFFLMVTFFSFGIHSMGGKFDDGDYLGLPRPIFSWIQMFRNSIGDIAEVGYGVWERPEGYVSESLFSKYNGAIITIWTFWFLNMFIMLIVIVNFLIAEVSQTYDKVKSSGKTFLYLSKASVNKIAFDYRKSLGYLQQDSFVAIVFKSPRDLSNIAGGGDDMFGFTTAVRNELKKLIQPFKNELLKYMKQFSDTVEVNKKGTEWQMALQRNAMTRLAQQTDVLKEHNEEIHKTCRELLEIIPNLVPLVDEKAEEDNVSDGGDIREE